MYYSLLSLHIFFINLQINKQWC